MRWKTFDNLNVVERYQLTAFEKFEPGSLWLLDFLDFKFFHVTGIEDEKFLNVISNWATQGIEEIVRFRLRDIDCKKLPLNAENPVLILDKWFIPQGISASPTRMLTMHDPVGGSLERIRHMKGTVIFKVIHEEKVCFAKSSFEILMPETDSPEGIRATIALHSHFTHRNWTGPYEWISRWKRIDGQDNVPK